MPNSLNAVASKEYIERLQMTVEHLHKCSARHSHTVPVHESFQCQTVWQGEVEVFELIGHPKAKRCYGWSQAEGPDAKDERYVCVLEIPPVMNSITAVRLQIDEDFKTGNSQ